MDLVSGHWLECWICVRAPWTEEKQTDFNNKPGLQSADGKQSRCLSTRNEPIRTRKTTDTAHKIEQVQLDCETRACKQASLTMSPRRIYTFCSTKSTAQSLFLPRCWHIIDVHVSVGVTLFWLLTIFSCLSGE